MTHLVKDRSASLAEGIERSMHIVGWIGQRSPRSNYEFFNYNNLNIYYWSWNYHSYPFDPLFMASIIIYQLQFCES